MRRLLFAALAGASVVLGAAPAVLAQPGPPNRYYGSLTIDGAAAPSGTTVTAVIAGKDCGTRMTDTAGQYWVDAQSAAQNPGCGAPGAAVTFRVGTRTATQTATWEGGSFTKLDLVVSGAGPAPVPTTGPGATPPPIRFSIGRLDLNPDNSRCIPPAGQPACDGTRQALWVGDAAAWAAEFARQGKPEPTADDIFLATYEFRIGANDPAAIQSLAQGLGWPKIYITAIKYHGSDAGEGDEYIEITNVGGAAQDMTGWRAHAVESNTDWFFSPGSSLEPGATCRFYTGGARADSCPGSFDVSTTGVWNDDAGSAELWYDPLALLADSTSYNSNPATQPPPPNLRGAVTPVG